MERRKGGDQESRHLSVWGEGWTTQIRPSPHCQPTHWALWGEDKHPIDYRFEFVQTDSGSEGVMRTQLSDIWGLMPGLSPGSVVYNVVVISSSRDKDENTNNEAILTDNYSACEVTHATNNNMEIQTSFA